MAERESRSPLEHFKSCVLGDLPASNSLGLILRDWFRLRNEFTLLTPTNSERAENCKLLLEAVRNFQKRRGVEDELQNILTELSREGPPPAAAASSDNDEPQHGASSSRTDDAPVENDEFEGSKRKRRRAASATSTARSARVRGKSPPADMNRSDGVDSIQELSSDSESADEVADTTNADRECGFCGVTETAMWRRGPMGEATLCNACGVKWSQKRRNPTKQSSSPSDSPISDPNSFSDPAIADKDFYWCQYCNLSWPFSYFKNRQQFGAHCSNCSRKRHSRDGSGGTPHYVKGDPIRSTQKNEVHTSEVDAETAAERPTPAKRPKISATAQPSSPRHSFGFDADSAPPSFGFDHSDEFAGQVDDPAFRWSTNSDDRVQGLEVLHDGSNNLEVGMGALLQEDMEDNQEAKHAQTITKYTHVDDVEESKPTDETDIRL
eukprot:TRINITY_DN4834_c0_g1_i1.p1 TRINITY_DN4834_c0_g1~~TRINITY_DN4834_c0_g1_i1.p1  ORF type:complete len:437 (+),score=72.21 TRINITY_DN4834_c0_g1_i1:221-1531(+)